MIYGYYEDAMEDVSIPTERKIEDCVSSFSMASIGG